MDRRGFLGAAGTLLTVASNVPAVPLTEKDKLARIASNTYPVRSLFRRSAAGRGGSPAVEALRKQYGEITLLDFPQFTRDTFPGVHHMDLWSSLFGDVADSSMFERIGQALEFDPSSASGRKWLDQLAGKIATTGVKCHHVSNNAPRDICELEPERRKAGIAVARKWLEACGRLGAKTMRVNTGGPRIVPSASAAQGGYPRNDQVVQYLKNAIESFKEMADYGGQVGVKVTIENHWGLTADPTRIVIMLNAVNSKWCEATPDFCNWENEHMLFNGLRILVPYSHSNVHAKYWSRWGDKNDVRKSVKIMMDGKYDGVFALEYEEGPMDYIEGAKYLYKEVLAAL